MIIRKYSKTFANSVTANPGRNMVKKGEVIPVIGRGGCETSRLPHFLDSRPIYGGEVVSLTRRPPFTPRKIPDTQFC
jgi:hypothetical protein